MWVADLRSDFGGTRRKSKFDFVTFIPDQTISWAGPNCHFHNQPQILNLSLWNSFISEPTSSKLQSAQNVNCEMTDYLTLTSSTLNVLF